MKVLRILAACAVALVAALALLWLAQEWQCNEEKVRLEYVARQMEQHGTIVAVPAARENMNATRKCLLVTPGDPDLHLLVKSYALVMGDREMAAAALRDALRFERRPELFLELGLLEVDMHQREAGVRDLITACTFYPGIHEDIPYYDVRVEVFNAVKARQDASVARGKRP
jgi:hypothetical protein